MKDALITWFLVEVALPIIGTIVIVLLGRAAMWANKKFKMDITQQEIANAVNFAERLAENAIKNNQSKLTSNEKLNVAVDYINRVLPGQNQEIIRHKIEAAVQQYRGNGNPCK